MTPPTAALPIAAVECPFCLATLGYVEQDNGQHGDSEPEYRYTCESCGAQGPGEPEEANAISAWNYRGAYGAPAVQATADADETAREIAITATVGEIFNFTLQVDHLDLSWKNGVAAIIRKAVSPKAAAETHSIRQWLIVWPDGSTTIIDRAPDSYECRESKSMHALETILHWVPEGWQLVPKKLTPTMSSAMGYTDAGTDASWERALAASPIPASPAAVSGDKQEKERE